MTNEELIAYQKELDTFELRARENMAYTQSKIVKRYMEDINGIELGDDDIPKAEDVDELYSQLTDCELYVRRLSETLTEIQILKSKLNKDSE